jgi:hypothetical protein
METNVSIPGRERRCEAKTPRSGKVRPDAAKKPGLGFPQPGDKVKAAVCRLRFAKNYLLRVIFVSSHAEGDAKDAK